MDRRIAMIPEGQNIVENIAIWNDEKNEDGSFKHIWQPAGYALIDVTDRPEVSAGWAYNPEAGTFAPESE